MSEEPERLIAVFGPRQTGKTTAVRQAMALLGAEHLYVAVDRPEPVGDPYGPPEYVDSQPEPSARDRRWLVWVWRYARRQAVRSDGRFVLVLDEIQKMSGWSEVVKGLWDADRAEGPDMHVVVLGSSPLLMQSGLNESLAGRFEPLRFTHWSYGEMHEAFGLDLDHYIYFGGYPGAADLVSDERRWRGYVTGALIEPIIERDVLAMARVDKPALLKSLFEMGALYSGRILSYNKMLGQLQDAGNTTTLARYLKLLSDAGLLTGLSKHTERPVSARKSSPKLNVMNNALMSALSGYGYGEARADRTFWGKLVESAVGAHLLNTALPGTEVRYWRDSVREVDFVLRKGRRAAAIEVKTGQAVSTHAGLETFVKRFRPEKALLVGSAELSLRDFLSAPADHWFGA